MGLISKEVNVTINGSNVKIYESIGYKIPRYTNNRGKQVFRIGTKILVKVDDLHDESNVLVDVTCDCCEKKYSTIWRNYKKYRKEDNKIYCSECAMKLYGTKNRVISALKNGTSFEAWCISNGRADLLELWDYELNKISTKEVTFSSNVKYYFKCSRGLHRSTSRELNTITSAINYKCDCPQCNSFGQWLKDNYGEDGIIKYWATRNIIDPFEIGYGSMKKVYTRCVDCGFEKLVTVNNFIRQGVSCPKCGDGLSYPNKFAFNMLQQLNINFINEYSPKWVSPKRYDFYFEANNKKYIVEMDGGFHVMDSHVSNLLETKINDNNKDKLAVENNIEVIRIDCNYNGVANRFEYIKNSIINSRLSITIDLSNVDWLKCNEYACKSLIKDVNVSWNSDNNVNNISNMYKLSIPTIIGYLKIGNDFGWCEYDGELEKIKSKERQSIKIYCVELDRVFKSINNIKIELGICIRHISDCCNNKQKYKTCGGYHWMFYDDYIKTLNIYN